MEFKRGASVYTIDDEKVGEIARIVMNPATHEVTHLVVEKGFFFKEDRVVPITWIDYTSPDRVQLKANHEEDDLVQFEETHFIPSEDYDPAMQVDTEDKQIQIAPPTYYYYAPIGTWWSYPMSTVNDQYITVMQKNVPADALVLQTGATVMTVDDHHAGTVDQIVTDPETNRITHFVISKGLLLAEKKLIPAYWVSATSDNQVDLTINKQTLERLPEYVGA